MRLAVLLNDRWDFELVEAEEEEDELEICTSREDEGREEEDDDGARGCLGAGEGADNVTWTVGLETVAVGFDGEEERDGGLLDCGCTCSCRRLANEDGAEDEPARAPPLTGMSTSAEGIEILGAGVECFIAEARP